MEHEELDVGEEDVMRVLELLELNWGILDLGLGRDEKPERQAARRELGGGPMEEKSLPRRGFKEERKKSNGFLLLLVLPLLVFVSSFPFLALHPFSFRHPETRNAEQVTWNRQEKRKKKKIAQTQIPMEYVSSNHHHSSVAR